MAGAELATLNVQAAGSALESGRIAQPEPLPWMTRIEQHPSWEVLAQLRVTLRAGVALNRFRVRDLLTLSEGQVFESLSPDTDDVSLLVGQVQVGWSEFEVLEQRMALRLTRLG
jgi:flagellar motor switch protein FliM